MDPATGVSVIIPFHSKESDLSLPLKALEESYAALSPVETRKIELIIVNDHSPVAPARSASLPTRQIDLPENLGVSAARNAGIKAAGFENVLCLDSDIVVAEDFFTAVFEELAENAGQLLIQGMISARVPPGASLFSRYLAIQNHADALSYADADGKGGLLCSGCFMTTKGFFRAIGFFDEGFKASGGEEFEILRRLPAKAIFQSRKIVVRHQYEDLCPRLRKVWRRSGNYLATAVLNEAVPASLKLVGISRLFCAFVALAGAALGVFSFRLGAALFCFGLLGSLLCDGGIHLRHFWREGGARLVLASPFFFFLEYLVAGAGCLAHEITKVASGVSFRAQ